MTAALVILLIILTTATVVAIKHNRSTQQLPVVAAQVKDLQYSANKRMIMIDPQPIAPNEVDTALMIEIPTNDLPAAGTCLPEWYEFDADGKKLSGPHTPYETMPDGSKICALNGAYVESPLNTLNVNFQLVENPEDEKYCQTNWFHYDENLDVIGGPYDRVAIDALGSKWCPLNDALLNAVPGVTFDYMGS